MTDAKRDDAGCGGCEGEKLQRSVLCRRTGQTYVLGQHQRCPYCFGTKKDVATGDYGRFCDFQPGVDPVSFGYPGTSSREQRG